MPTKAEQYAQMADQVARQLTGSWQEWAGFLTTAARLYKYPFHEQLMIYAQRPDATACAEYDLWNNRMGRYVRRGSKGIALVDDSGDRPRLRYVFDISDTGTREHSRTPWLWTMNEEHTAPVMAMLERNYDVSGGDLAQQLADVAAKLAEEYWADHRRDILPIVDGSFLEEYDEYNIEVQFKSTAAVSITYALMSRCGLEPEQYFSHEDFMAIFDFNTPATVGALGTAVSQINQQVLRQIGVTIQNYERAKGAERSATHGKQPDLHEERRLPDPRPEAVRTAGEAPGQVRQDAQSVPEGTPAHPLQPAADEREAVPAPSGDRRDREQPSGADDAPAGGGSGRDGAAESQRPHAVGGPDEHLQGPGGGDPAGGTYQQLTLNLFLSEAEQIHKIDEAESVKTPSAFSMPKPAAQAEPVRRALTQAEIDAAIQEWNGNIESKHAVVRYMKDHAREKDTAAWLRQEYGDDLPALPVTVDGAAGDVPWPKVQRRIVQLIKEDRFYTEAEQDRFDNIDSIAIREALAERGIVNGQVVDPEKLDSDPFIRQVMRDVEAVATEEQAEAAAKPPVPDLSGQPVTREGDTLTIGSGEPPHEIDITVSDEEYAAIRGTIPERTAYDPSAPVYNVGNTVYLDDRAHQITELREDTVQLLPTGMSYPIYRVESRERFEQLLRADNRNDFYTEFLPVNPDTADQDLRDVLAHGLIGAPNKAELSELLRTGKSNREVALWLSRAYPDIIETMELETGDTADYRTIPEGIELEVLDADEKRLAMLFFRWDEVAPLLRGLYARQLDGFVQEQDEPYMEAPAAVEEPAETAKPIEEAAEAPAFHSETVAVYPGDKNGLPYDVVVERLHVDRPEPTPPEPTPDTQPEEKPDHPVAIPVNGEWQTFPNQRAAEQAAYQEYRDNLRRNAENFRITDDHLGEGGPKAKYQANVAAIKLLKYLEETTGQATPEQQEVLSRYVGWGGVADAFDPDKPAWDAEYSELKELLTPEKYAAARASTLNAHYTSPTVIRANAYKILEDSLNLRDVRIYDTVEDADGKERRVLNAKETTLAAQKQQAIRDAFRDWIWRDPERRQALVRQYNEEMNATRPREYDGSHIVFGGMNPAITLREHQKNAIAHVLYGGNTLLAHEVGAGKTFEMVGAAMEAKRLGLCQKSLFVVPNHLTEQWASEFLRLYPSANILVTTKKDFEKHNRKKFCARIATGDYDAIIMGHSQFEKIPISKERQERLLHEQIWEITEGIAEVEASGGERFTVKQLERTKKSLEARLEKLQAEDRKDDVVTFEQLGVDRLFVDEAHNYKNLFLYTKMRNVAGLSTTDAQKSSDMFAKCRYMDEITGGRGVVFATGTPVSNSMTELYTMQRYLQYDRLQELGMAHFDCWASRFGETVTALELAPEGTGYRARTRFSKFFNLPELMNLFKEVADIKTADQLHLPTPEVEYHNIVAQPTEQQQEMVKALSERASLVHSGTVDPSQDNMLKITSDGRKLGLDQRLINQLLPDEPGTKVNQCVDNIMQIWRDGEADKLTQLVFCDISTPQARPAKKVAKALDNPTLHALEDAVPLDEPEPAFTVYEDIRQKLIAKGVPAEQIAFIHEANTEVRKKELFSKVRTGQVRVLLGSTAKMGAGTNVQDRLVALHDLDCPWRPGDLAQRKGRIERQGNQNETVHVYRYVTEGTFDAYLWQTVENKQKFISQIMTSKSPVRSCDDVDETALSFAEIKALCAGDPRIKERMDLDVDVARLKLMKADHQSKQYRLEDQLLKTFPEEIEKNKGFIAGLEADMATLAAHPHPEDGFAGMEVRGDTLTDKENAGAALLDACKEVKGADPVPVGSYRGFTMSVSFDAFRQEYMLLLKGQMTHRATLGTDPRGNLTRIDNALSQMPQRLEAVKNQLDNLYQQQAAAKAEVGKPFPQEQELRD